MASVMKLFSAWRKYFVLGIAAILFGATPARAELVIDITRGFVEPLPVAVTDFFGESPDETKVGADIAGVIAANLERSGLFRPIDKGAFIQDPNTLRAGPRFGDWRLINAQALISGSTQVQVDGRLRVEFRLWDVFAETQMTGLAYFTTPTNWRRVAHIISDAIYKRLTGEEGYFDTRIVYISETGPQNRRVKRLSIMDQDGPNPRFPPACGAPVRTPRSAPPNQDTPPPSCTHGTAETAVGDPAKLPNPHREGQDAHEQRQDPQRDGARAARDGHDTDHCIWVRSDTEWERMRAR